ncbi:MAG: S-layer homology domain-containing protein [Eubacteriales bacterium]|nr:S-layer homology domain-containing protein [Eubacteriales bacterium]
MLKKMISALFVALTVIVGASAAQSIFPVSRTDADGVTRSGYLDEEGITVLPFAYAKAGEFADCGLAAVEDNKWQTAVIDRQGNLVVPYTEAPVTVDFSDEMLAYRYTDHSVYYTLEGKQVGSYAGAVGFFEDGLLLCKSPASDLYVYLKEDGTQAFAGEFKDAGVFSGGRALVQTTAGAYLAIDTAGQTLYTLESSIVPSYMTIFGEDTVVLSNGTNQALYSLEDSAYITDFLYNSISEFHEGAAMVRQINRWGLMDVSGRLLTEPTYYYLSYMGEGLYAARSADGSAAAVDANGNIAYRTPSYVGGFNELHYGLSWHGMADGSLIFFRKNGGYFAGLKNAENPTLLSQNVVRVTQDGATRYINLSDGKILLEQPQSFNLGSGITAKTVHYERFLGYQANGSEHGWNVDFPDISGLPDAAVQKKINAAIREFFLKGPSITAEYEALEGGYGVSVEGSVLVVWANCVSGKGAGSSVWNNNLAFDMHTGEQYQIGDLFVSGYIDEVKGMLPDDHAIYLYSFPRMSTKGVTYFYNEYESESRRAYTESYLLPFDQLRGVLDRSGACYTALQTPFTRPVTTVAGFSDVGKDHWAAPYIQIVADKGLMNGAGGKFRPDEAITTAEVCATIARSQKLEDAAAVMDGISPTAWYAGEVSAVEAAGLLDGLTEDFQPDAAITRAAAMRLFANLLVKNGSRLPDDAAVKQALSAFSDQADIPAEHRAAVVLCIQKGLVKGYADGTLLPQGAFTRAEFAKLLTMI